MVKHLTKSEWLDTYYGRNKKVPLSQTEFVDANGKSLAVSKDEDVQTLSETSTVKEIKKVLKDDGVEFKSSASKAELLELAGVK